MLGNTLLISGLLLTIISFSGAPFYFAGIPLLIFSYFVIKKENKQIEEKENKNRQVEKYDDDQYKFYIKNKWELPLDYKTIRAADRVNEKGISDAYKSVLIEGGDYNLEPIPIDHKSWLNTQIKRLHKAYEKKGREALINLNDLTDPWNWSDKNFGILFSTPEKYKEICEYLDLYVDQDLVDNWTGKKQEEESLLEEKKHEKKQKKINKKKSKKEEIDSRKKALLVSNDVKFRDVKKILNVKDAEGDDKQITYYENGNLKEEKIYFAGYLESWKTFYSEGSLEQEFKFRNGVPWSGRIFNQPIWDDKPSIFAEYRFIQGYEIFMIKYYSNEKIYMQKSYHRSTSSDDEDNEDDEVEAPKEFLNIHYNFTKYWDVFEQFENFELKIREYYNKEGNYERVERYSGGLKHGFWEYYDKDERLIKSEQWENGSIINDELGELDKEKIEQLLEQLKQLYEKELISEAVYTERQKELIKKIK